MRLFSSATRLLKPLLLLAGIAFVSACSSLPEELELPEEKEPTLVGFGTVIQAPERYVGQLVRWGGVIANVSNKSDHTLIEVTYYPLQYTGRPKVDEKHSAGRFRTKLQGLADPMVYKQGKSITFLGQLGEPQSSQIGEFNYKFPLLLAQQHVLWQELKQYDDWDYRYHGYPYRHYPWGWNYPYYDPFYPYPHRGVKSSHKKMKKIDKAVKPIQ